ncbi:hypothetical protein EPC69_01675 [Helicobacter pylori]|nr:hypothetical protein EPC70_03140 [Helicobacter pylori]KAA6508596.1 hypothetical protein EPC81_07500 [Helicobacter pylori]KAA6516298.1 hypothetical protein EPC69_01675 [Helicobacter pylori]
MGISFIQYSFLKNLFLSFLIVNFCFVVKLFLKRIEDFEITPFLTPLNPLKKRFKKLSLVSCVSSFIFVLKCL